MLRFLDWLRHVARLRRWNADRAWGRRGEDLAHRHLRRNGYVVTARNFRTRSGSGEVDLVAWEGDVIAFVEVKTRRTEEYGPADRAVDREKQRKLVIAAREYCRRADVDWERTRFDVVSVVLEPQVQVVLRRDAFARPLLRSAPARAAAV